MNKTIHTNCPIAKTAQLLSDSWTMLIIRDLLGNSMRFCEIETSLDGISSRTLALKLKRLEEEKIIKKSELYYSLTAQGKKLKKVIDAMESWGKTL
ncbi:MAG: helix-turn-helix domain-containing protein [Candidatus Nomurabacteria bacterium]